MLPRILIAALATLGSTLSGCDGQPAGAAAGTAPSFEARCAALPQSRFDVVATPIHVTFDDSRSHRELTAMNQRAVARHLTLGLTHARIGHRAAIAVNGVQASGGERVCMRVTAHVALAMDPLIVYVARELAADPCRRGAVREHELQHVAVYEAVLSEGAPALALALDAAFGGRTFGGPTVAAVKAEVEEGIARHLDAFLETTGRAVQVRQAAVDTPEEYARVAAACGGGPPR